MLCSCHPRLRLSISQLHVSSDATGSTHTTLAGANWSNEGIKHTNLISIYHTHANFLDTLHNLTRNEVIVFCSDSIEWEMRTIFFYSNYWEHSTMSTISCSATTTAAWNLPPLTPSLASSKATHGLSLMQGRHLAILKWSDHAQPHHNPVPNSFPVGVLRLLMNSSFELVKQQPIKC